MSTNAVHVGTVPRDFEDWTTTKVYFHGFADLSTTRNKCVKSPKFLLFGHKWQLRLYPGGKTNSREGYVALSLFTMSNSGIEISYGYSVRDASGEEVVYRELSDTFAACRGRLYTKELGKRSDLMDALVDGSLIIEVLMKTTSTSKSVTQFIPKNPINKNMSELYNDEESADVVFEVKQRKRRRGMPHPSTVDFYAHRLILKKSAPTLYEMCGESDGEGITKVSITDVFPEFFENILLYIYGLENGHLEEASSMYAKYIIDKCDKYGVVNLKLKAEVRYVNSTEISMENMMEILLYADSKNLALIKEAVMDFIVANKKRIVGKVSFDNVPGSTVSDILAAMARGEPDDDDDSSDEEEDESIKYNTMRVGTLRQMLDERGLDVDGSREMLIATLKEAEKKKGSVKGWTTCSKILDSDSDDSLDPV